MDKYQVYDRAIGYLMRDIAERTKEADEISLINFTPKNYEHMTILYAAMYTGSLTNKKVVLNLPWLEYIKFRFANKDMRRWYKNRRNNKNTVGNLNVPNEISEVYTHVEGSEVFENGIGCIYEEYYNPKRKDNI